MANELLGGRLVPGTENAEVSMDLLKGMYVKSIAQNAGSYSILLQDSDGQDATLTLSIADTGGLATISQLEDLEDAIFTGTKVIDAADTLFNNAHAQYLGNPAITIPATGHLKFMVNHIAEGQRNVANVDPDELRAINSIPDGATLKSLDPGERIVLPKFLEPDFDLWVGRTATNKIVVQSSGSYTVDRFLTVWTVVPHAQLSTAQVQDVVGNLLEGATWTGGSATYDSNTNTLQITVSGATGTLTIGASAPASPVTGAIWSDTRTNTLRRYTGTEWTPVGSAAPTEHLFLAATEPTTTSHPTLKPGDLWVNTQTFLLYVYHDQNTGFELVTKSNQDIDRRIKGFAQAGSNVKVGALDLAENQRLPTPETDKQLQWNAAGTLVNVDPPTGGGTANLPTGVPGQYLVWNNQRVLVNIDLARQLNSLPVLSTLPPTADYQANDVVNVSGIFYVLKNNNTNILSGVIGQKTVSASAPDYGADGVIYGADNIPGQTSLGSISNLTASFEYPANENFDAMGFIGRLQVPKTWFTGTAPAELTTEYHNSKGEYDDLGWVREASRDTADYYAYQGQDTGIASDTTKYPHNGLHFSLTFYVGDSQTTPLTIHSDPRWEDYLEDSLRDRRPLDSDIQHIAEQAILKDGTIEPDYLDADTTDKETAFRNKIGAEGELKAGPNVEFSVPDAEGRRTLELKNVATGDNPSEETLFKSGPLDVAHPYRIKAVELDHPHIFRVTYDDSAEEFRGTLPIIGNVEALVVYQRRGSRTGAGRFIFNTSPVSTTRTLANIFKDKTITKAKIKIAETEAGLDGVAAFTEYNVSDISGAGANTLIFATSVLSADPAELATGKTSAYIQVNFEFSDSSEAYEDDQYNARSVTQEQLKNVTREPHVKSIEFEGTDTTVVSVDEEGNETTDVHDGRNRHEIEQVSSLPSNSFLGERIQLTDDITIPGHTLVNAEAVAGNPATVGFSRATPVAGSISPDDLNIDTILSYPTSGGQADTRGKTIVQFVPTFRKTPQYFFVDSRRYTASDVARITNGYEIVNYEHRTGAPRGYAGFVAGDTYGFNVQFTDDSYLFPTRELTPGDYTFNGNYWDFTPGTVVSPDHLSGITPEANRLVALLNQKDFVLIRGLSKIFDSDLQGLSVSSSNGNHTTALQGFAGSIFNLDDYEDGQVTTELELAIAQQEIGLDTGFGIANNINYRETALTSVSALKRLTTYNAGLSSVSPNQVITIARTPVVNGAGTLDAEAVVYLAHNSSNELGYIIRLNGGGTAGARFSISGRLLMSYQQYL